MAFLPSGLSQMSLLASTGLAGFTYQNATPNIISYTFPSDGKLHRFLLIPYVTVTSTQTGGALAILFRDPTNAAQNFGINGGGNNVGTNGWGNGFTNWDMLFAYPGSTVTLQQSSAQTAGAATIWAELWGL